MLMHYKLCEVTNTKRSEHLKLENGIFELDIFL
jgi:hypothetical protein